MRQALFLAAALLATLAGAQQTEEKTNPGSLVTPSYQNPYLDRVARRVGDLLTVIVDEQNTANYTASTEATKNDKTSFSFSFVNNILNRLFRPLSASASSSVKGDGKTNQTGTMQTRMSVLVKQVLPNGNLLIEGKRTLVTNKETQTFVLSGEIRPYDIKPDNTVKSTQIANAEIRMEGKGMIQDRQRKGLITTILDIFF
ncbi:MAG: flagellar basal body L-ring protein FlgH [Fimbriimonadaceae bacterium]|nr:flagellar basal body L-ring protein FlgH [Fimbriimonadaceae bacterium]QYK55896.1 MAG: flagellar basal body L-ring protein FlgH [Fimbriimonadaceae bacterium]